MSCQVRREQDEMVCTACGLRWDRGEDKPLCQPLPLSPAETRLHATMKLDEDIAIEDMWGALDPSDRTRTLRSNHKLQQQFVGAHVTRLNRKLEDRGLVIVPGVARRTYTLKRIA